MNKRTFDLLLQRNPSIEFRDITRCPIDTLYVDYKKQPVRQLGSIQIPISSSGWKVDNAQFLISENRTRNLLGLNLQEQLGVVNTQLKAESVQSLENISPDSTSDYWSCFFAKKHARVFSSVAKLDLNIIKFILTLNFLWCHVKLKDVKFRSTFRIELRAK